MEDNKAFIASAAACVLSLFVLSKLISQDAKITQQADDISLLKFELCQSQKKDIQTLKG